MNKKIQTSTIEMMGTARVINLSASFVCRTVRAMMTTKSALSNTRRPVYKKDEIGEIVKDENGNNAFEFDANGNQMFEYDRYKVDSDDVRALWENVLPLLEDLVEAIENEE